MRVSFVWPVLALLLAARVAVAVTLDLHWDETYYWQWSRHMALSFYDHPPMVAYGIWLGTALFGDTALGIRAPAIAAMLAASVLVYWLAMTLFADRRMGLLSLLWFSVMPHTGFFSVIMFPDTPALLFWVLTCCALAQVWRTGQGGWWYLAGAALGLTMLSKYTGAFLALGTVAWVGLSAEMRPWLRRKQPYLAALLGLAVFSPVLLWNAQHGWVSFTKQFGRVLDAAPDAGLANAGAYLGVQAAFVSPLIYAFCLAGSGVALWRGVRPKGGQGQGVWLLLALTSLPTLLFFLVHALTDIVKPQWPSAAYPTAIIAGVAAFAPLVPSRPWVRRAFVAAPWVGLAATAALYLQMTLTLVPVAAAGDPLAIFAGWANLARATSAAAVAQQAGYIATTGYVPAALFRFYLNDGPPVLQLSEALRYTNEAPVDQSVLAQNAGLYLAPAAQDDIAALRPHFDSVTPLPPLVRARRGDAIAEYRVYRLDGYRGGLPLWGAIGAMSGTR